MYLLILGVNVPAFCDQQFRNHWSAEYERCPLADIDVILSPGCFVDIFDLEPIMVFPDESSPDPLRTFKGCKTSPVDIRCPVSLSAKVEATSPAAGEWSATLTPDRFDQIGKSSLTICVYGHFVKTSALLTGACAGKKTKVAELKIYVAFN